LFRVIVRVVEITDAKPRIVGTTTTYMELRELGLGETGGD